MSFVGAFGLEPGQKPDTGTVIRPRGAVTMEAMTGSVTSGQAG